MVEIELHGVSKYFGQVVALKEIALSIGDGDLMVLLGPSGCGKTTMLNLVAGLDQPTEGRIYFDGKDMTDVPPHKRGVGMVFQNGGLFPHLTIEQNITYGLEARNWEQEKIKERVSDVMELTRLGSTSKRYPHQVSGGQRQRAALARALAPNPQILLLDEPLSFLDARLKDELRWEIMDIQRRLRITTIYVTHDHDEAFYLSTKIAVMREGTILQTGDPKEIYENPSKTFVAWFVGYNILRPIEGGADGGGKAYLAVKPEDARISSEKGSAQLTGRLVAIDYRRSSYSALVVTKYGKLEAVIRKEEAEGLRGYLGQEVGLNFKNAKELLD